MVVIVWELDLQLPVQSVPITINVVSSNPIQVRWTRHSFMWKSDLQHVGGFLRVLQVHQ
jgi:hypothetical protein